MRAMLVLTVPLLGVLSGACAQTASQPIGGKVLQSSFPKAVRQAVVLDAKDAIVASADVADDGAFALDVPVGAGLRIAFAAEKGQPVLIFPRKGGSIDSRFDVKASASTSFDLGSVRYVGDANSAAFSFGATQALTADDDGECEDGHDQSGAVCVDDDDDEGASCEADDDGEADDGEADGEEDDDGVDCVDGIDAATGAECDGGPGANQDDGEEDDDDDAAASDAAVADHNLPASLGCDDGEEDDDGESDDDGEGDDDGEQADD